MKTWTSNCRDCGAVIDWDGEGGILWAGDVFCPSHDPLEPSGEEESKASSVRYAPERTINDLVKEIEEGKANE